MDKQRKNPRAPGLGLERRENGTLRWRATKDAVAKGYRPKNRPLPSDADEARLVELCERYNAEMRMWLSGRGTPAVPNYDGTFKSLFRIYQTHEQSSFHKIKPTTLYPYNFYLPMLIEQIGGRVITECSGLDADRWFKSWCEPAKVGGKRTLAKAHMCISIIKAALGFGILCKFAGCADLKAILAELKLEGMTRRKQAPTADQIIAVRKVAHQRGHGALALAYAIQFEGTNRQYDVMGQWVSLSDKRPSAVIDGKEKWLGATWNHVDKNLVLRFMPGKTDSTTAKEVVIDFKACPMVMEELQHIPVEARTGPLIVNSKTGRPYKYREHKELWRRTIKRKKDGTNYRTGIAVDAGIPDDIWNRDLRAGGISEARRAAVPREDVAKVAGHAHERSTDGYDRTALVTQQRMMEARLKRRQREAIDPFEQ